MLYAFIVRFIQDSGVLKKKSKTKCKQTDRDFLVPHHLLVIVPQKIYKKTTLSVLSDRQDHNRATSRI